MRPPRSSSTIQRGSHSSIDARSYPATFCSCPGLHVATLPDLPVAEVGPLFTLAQRLTRAVPQATGGDGAFVAINNVVSQSVPHLHVHVVPRRHDDRLFSRNLAWTRRPYRDDDEMRQVAAAIRTALGDLTDGE